MSATEQPIADVPPTPPEAVRSAAICPVDRMTIRRRNRICLRVIYIGGLNFLLFTILYAAIGGDAPNGHYEVVRGEDGTQRTAYYVRGHFIRSLTGREREVSRGLWIYSYLHSITLPLTSGAMIVSMLILARPHILATLRDGWMRGGTFITVFVTLLVVLSVGAAFLFAWDFVAALYGT
jgi:hypothetical protein